MSWVLFKLIRSAWLLMIITEVLMGIKGGVLELCEVVSSAVLYSSNTIVKITQQFCDI